MRRNIQRILLLLLGVIFIQSAALGSAFAGAADIGIEPAYPRSDNERTQSIFIMQLKAGEQGEDGLRIVNSGKIAHTVDIYSTDSSYSVDGSFSCRQRAEPVKDVGSWVKLETNKLTLEAGEQKIVKFKISLPDGTGPGEHDGCIAVQDNVNLPAKTGSGVLLGFRSAVRLAVTVPGKIIKKLNIVNVEIKRVDNRGISVSPIAKNGGNVSLDVESRAQLISIFGQETKIKSGAKYPILQGATTGWAYVFEGPYWGGIYKARTSLSYNADPNSGLGQVNNNQQRIRGESGWFVVYPSLLAGTAELAVFAAVIWLIITPLRNRMRRRRMAARWSKYVVKDGDTLESVAKNHHIKWKKLAKQNTIRAPYIIDEGQIILVPKTHRNKAKTTSSPGDDWLNSDDISSESDESIVSHLVHKAEDDAEDRFPEEGWTLPADNIEKAPIKVHKQDSHTTNTLFPEPEDGAVLDWREGASEEELRQFGVIADSSNVSSIGDDWNIDQDDDSGSRKEKKTVRSSSSAKKKTVRTNKKSKTNKSIKKRSK